MLTGQAKADYQRAYMRSYMRRKRAGTQSFPRKIADENDPITEAEMQKWLETEARLGRIGERILGVKFVAPTRKDAENRIRRGRKRRREQREHRAVLKARKIERQAKQELEVNAYELRMAEYTAEQNGWLFDTWPPAECPYCGRTKDKVRMAGTSWRQVCRDCARKIVAICESNSYGS